MNLAALPVANSCPSTPGLYFARMSCTGGSRSADNAATCGGPSDPGGAARRAVQHAFGRVLHPERIWRANPRLHVVNRPRVARTHFGGLHPHVLVEVRVHEHVLLIDDTGRRQLDVFRHRHDDVRRSNRPPVVEHHRRGSILRIALGRALLGPGRDGRDLRRRSAPSHSRSDRSSDPQTMAASSWSQRLWPWPAHTGAFPRT